MRPRPVHHRPRLTEPTIASLQDTWTELNTELSITTDPHEVAHIRQRIAEVERAASKLIEGVNP